MGSHQSTDKHKSSHGVRAAEESDAREISIEKMKNKSSVRRIIEGKDIYCEFDWTVMQWSYIVNAVEESYYECDNYWSYKDDNDSDESDTRVSDTDEMGEDDSMNFYSPSFLSHENGYKMCLGVVIFGHDKFGIQWYLMRGSFDDDLQWPFAHDVTIDIIDQRTGLPYYSETVKFADYPNEPCWKRPVKKINESIPFPPVSFDEIATMMTQQHHDQLSVKCRLRVTRN